MHFQSIGVIGAGAWGTALAQATAQTGRDVIVWALEDEVAEAISTAHEQTVYLPVTPLNPAITCIYNPVSISRFTSALSARMAATKRARDGAPSRS